MITLLVKNSKSNEESQTYTFSQKLIRIGRLKENEITLKDVSVSRQHAVITFVDGEYKITDTSKNGTFLNGELIGRNGEKVLRSGDNIQISNFVINVDIEDDYKNFEKTSELIQHCFADSSSSALNVLFPYIEVVGGITSGERYEFVEDYEEIILGRAPNCDIQIPHKSVSKNHAKIVKKKNTFDLIDLNSSNGVFVNGIKVNGSTTLKDRDEIVLGQVEESEKIKIVFIDHSQKETNEKKENLIVEEKEEKEIEADETEGKPKENVEAKEKPEMFQEDNVQQNKLEVTNTNTSKEELLGIKEKKEFKLSVGEYILIGLAVLLGLITLVIIIYSVLT